MERGRALKPKSHLESAGYWGGEKHGTAKEREARIQEDLGYLHIGRGFGVVPGNVTGPVTWTCCLGDWPGELSRGAHNFEGEPGMRVSQGRG